MEIHINLQGELVASFLIPPPGRLCLSDQFVDYRGKLESIMEPTPVPALGFAPPVVVFSWKPPDQGDVGRSPERILSDKKRSMKLKVQKYCNTTQYVWSLNATSFVFPPKGHQEFRKHKLL